MLVSCAAEVLIPFLCPEQVLTAVSLFGCIAYSRCSSVLNPSKSGNLSALNAVEKLLPDFFFHS